MIEYEQIHTQYPKSAELLQQFLSNNHIDYSTSALIYFLDTKFLFVGITCDGAGIDWIIELNGIIINTMDSRIEAEDFAVNEGFYILEKQ
jgi:hypothetical protein